MAHYITGLGHRLFDLAAVMKPLADAIHAAVAQEAAATGLTIEWVARPNELSRLWWTESRFERTNTRKRRQIIPGDV
jgi:hypothetical protein